MNWSAFSSAAAFIFLSASTRTRLIGVNFSSKANRHGISCHFRLHVSFIIPASGHAAQTTDLFFRILHLLLWREITAMLIEPSLWSDDGRWQRVCKTVPLPEIRTERHHCRRPSGLSAAVYEGKERLILCHKMRSARASGTPGLLWKNLSMCYENITPWPRLVVSFRRQL